MGDSDPPTQSQDAANVDSGPDSAPTDIGTKTSLSVSSGCAAASATASRRVLFLYKLVRGTAHSSFGLNVARLAELPTSVVDAAAIQASNMQALTAARSCEAARRLLSQLAELLRTEAVPTEKLSMLVSAAGRMVEDMQVGSHKPT